MLVYGQSWQFSSNLFSTYCVASQYASNVRVQKLYGFAFKSLFSIYDISIIWLRIFYLFKLAHTLTDNFWKNLNSNAISKNFNTICAIGCARAPRHPIQLDQPPLIYGQTLKKMHSEQRTKTHTIHFFSMKYLAYIVNKTGAELAIKIKELVFRTFHSLF